MHTESTFDIFVFAVIVASGLLLAFDIIFLYVHIKRYRKTKTRFRLRLRYLWHYSLLINYAFVAFLIAGIYLLYIKVEPKIISSFPATEGFWEDYNEPIIINFNIPVDRYKLVTNMSPLMKGRWEYKPYLGISRLTEEVRFYPEESLFPEQRIVIYLTGISHIRMNESHEGGIVLQSANLPEVESTLPYNRTNQLEVNQEIKIMFDKPIEDTTEISFKMSPETEFEVENLTPLLYQIVPKRELQQSTNYVITVTRTPKRINLNTNEIVETDNPELIHRLEFTTVKEPFIKSISPKGSGIKADSNIRFRFETEMDPTSTESLISYTPEIIGTYSWQDKRTLLYTPDAPLTKGTKYTISIAPGLKSSFGGTSEKTINQEFETIGAVRISEAKPANGLIKVNIASDISVTFDQEVDHASAESKFSISPNVAGSFKWEGNRMIYDVGNLGFGIKYSVTLAEGIKSIYGIDSQSPYTFSFTTRGQEVVISMPWYAQPQSPVSFTCNIVSAQMALAWKGFNTSASSLINEIGYNTSYNGTNWTGNPYKEFVGCSDGYCGYGVYWTALQKVFTNRGIKTEVKTGSNVIELAKSIENGHPVIIWRYNGTSTDMDIDWVASDGTYVDAIRGQHGGVVTGYKGTVENPTAFYINDPWFGLVWMDRNTFDYYWSRLNRSSLVIL